LQIKTKNVSDHTADSKPVKQEVNGTVILPHLVFPDQTFDFEMFASYVFTKLSQISSFVQLGLDEADTIKSRGCIFSCVQPFYE
jgi:hypothetical protein